MRGRTLLVLVTLGAAALTIAAQPPAQISAAPPDDDAARFGAQEMVYSLELSADGKRVVMVGPTADAGTVAVVNDLGATTLKSVGTATGKPLNLTTCDWSGTERVVCMLYGITRAPTGVRIPAQRLLAVDSAGGNVVMLGQDSSQQARLRQFDGTIIDWQNGVDDQVLMSRFIVPTLGGRTTKSDEEGLGVYRMDTRTGKALEIEKPDRDVSAYISDGLGTVRIRTVPDRVGNGRLKGTNRHYYRKTGERIWQLLGVDTDKARMVPFAVDPTINAAYAVKTLDGRLALYRISLDGSLREELVFASKEVDIGGVVRVGRSGRVIGATYVTDTRQIEYFDPDYKSIAKGLAGALPNLPLVYIISASANERVLLIRASSDVEPGRYYVYDRDARSLKEIMRSRPAMQGLKLSQVKAVDYAAADGTRIPGYLTLPPGITEARGLPAIVMPHGGPAARDEWGFHWLAQFYAQKGYAVLQPNFRGSAGYGETWFQKNGFQGWKQSIGDVCDGGRWLVAQGIADPAKLAILGWSYGGYAALQANVLDPDLFKAVIAIAPVTDLALLKSQAFNFTSYEIVSDFIGSGPHVREGSPAQQAQGFKAPVLLFHAAEDVNVDILHSRRMDKELRDAGKSSELVVYPDLDHGIRSGTARADMLRRSDAFLRQHLKL
jgi:dipeptidyl aminopeptidase/acylaminoacyl peptidase